MHKYIIHFVALLIAIAIGLVMYKVLNIGSVHRHRVTPDKIIEYTMHKEGGYVNDAQDLGGETKYGISAKTFKDVDIKNLTKEQAVQLYKDKYWNENIFPKIKDDRIRQKLFDMSVLMGHTQAVILLQRAMVASGRSIEIDGYFGKVTLKKLNECKNTEGLLWCFIGEIANYFRDVVQYNPSQAKFLKGWYNRTYDDYEDTNNDL